MELTVQVVEFMFYVYLVAMIVSDSVDTDITRHRYIDWVITTPVMLISFVVFFKYLKEPAREIRLFESIREETDILLRMLAANALMLLLGFLAESGVINTYVGVTLGFIPFAYAFKLLYAHYVKDNEPNAYWLYYASFIVWGLYGVAAVLTFASKNTMYNILDLFAKNAYGLFLFVYLRSVSRGPT